MSENTRKLEKIFIRDLLVRTVIGIKDEERLNRQDLLINVVLDCDIRDACLSDRIEESVNYRTVCKRIISMVENSSYFLLEKLTEEIASACLDFPKVHKVKVTIDKPASLRFARSVAVEVIRTKGSTS